ncbi:MAG: hypothetical protein CML95_02270 [Rhodobiaceae bacterium]|nr:hypothetical protein [Rhodobiaceae bacterium]
MPQTTQYQGARIIPCLVYHDADEAIIWFDRTLGFLPFCCRSKARALRCAIRKGIFRASEITAHGFNGSAIEN